MSIYEVFSLLGGVVFTDMVSDLERVSDHAINIAQALSETVATL